MDWLNQIDPSPPSSTVITYPFSDDMMIYDKVRHRYVLTEKGVEIATGIRLSLQVNTALGETNNVVNYYLRLISDRIYNFIYSKADNERLLEYVMAKSETCRQMLFDAMIAQTVYFVVNGDISQFAGVNIKTGSVVDRRIIKTNAISPDAELILLNTDIPELNGNTVLYQSRLNYYNLPTYEAGGY